MKFANFNFQKKFRFLMVTISLTILLISITDVSSKKRKSHSHSHLTSQLKHKNDEIDCTSEWACPIGRVCCARLDGNKNIVSSLCQWKNEGGRLCPNTVHPVPVQYIGDWMCSENKKCPGDGKCCHTFNSEGIVINTLCVEKNDYCMTHEKEIKFKDFTRQNSAGLSRQNSQDSKKPSLTRQNSNEANLSSQNSNGASLSRQNSNGASLSRQNSQDGNYPLQRRPKMGLTK